MQQKRATLLLFVFLSCATILTGCATAPAEDLAFAPGTRLNQLQIIGTHNSYKKRIEPSLIEIIRPFYADVDTLDYGHPPIPAQLDIGLRSLEIDIHYDPQGGLYTDPLGQRMLKALGHETEALDPQGKLNTPGFKVIHQADFDYRSWHLDFKDQLTELRDWSAANPGHLPVIITMNCKDGGPDYPGARQPAPFEADAFQRLDALMLTVLGRERLLVPDDVRGEADTLEQAVLTTGWPALADCRGRFLFVLDANNPQRGRYIAGHPSLRGRVLFTTSTPGTPEAAFLLLNNPIRQQAQIKRRVAQGYLVRTRADADTLEARRNDTSRFESAKNSGAHVISTDYPTPDPLTHPTYQVRFPGEVPYYILNPLTGLKLHF